LGVSLFRQGLSGPVEVTGYTTPDAVQLQRQLAAQKLQGASALAIEASSIGLDQGRMHGLHIDVAVFTNFTRDHLDYHGDMAAYESAKASLFDWPGLGHAVINLDDAMGPRLLAQVRKHLPAANIYGCTIAGAATEGIALLSASEIRTRQHGTVFQLTTPLGVAQVRTQLVGRFNVSNVLAIAAVLMARGLSLQHIVSQLELLSAVPGRMQQLGGVDAPLAVVDYAHTPDALDKALQTLREVALERAGALWCVFGCGGDRDPGKRPLMAAVAVQADHVIITSDNPRHEEPAVIIAQIVAGLDASQLSKCQIMEDRATAILQAIRHAGKNDVVLVAGKGHEAYQESKGRRQAFLDADHIALALATRATRHGGH
jgi:UDP-N-acetylmuramoyl-L-alanyl-D-glutamate--2,6-diaminopimelate ligase